MVIGRPARCVEECRRLAPRMQPIAWRMASASRSGQNGSMDTPVRTSKVLTIRPEDIATIDWVGDIDANHDGSLIAYTVTRQSLERDEPVSAIWVTPTDLAAPAFQFTSGTRRDTSPKWSPNGTKLAFLSERPTPDLLGPGADRPQLYVMPAAGGEALRLTSLPGGVTQLAWAPDGSRIAFIARVPSESPNDSKPLVLGDRSPSKPFRVIDTLKYRRNGEGFVDSRRQLFVVDVTGSTAAVQQTSGDFDVNDPCWSPDGSRIGFVSARHDSRDRDNAQSLNMIEIAAPNIGSGGSPVIRTVVQAIGPAAYPAWSPDGRWLAYAGHKYPVDTGRHTRVWVVSADGGDPLPIADSGDRNVAVSGAARPTWSSDSTEVLFTLEDDGATVLVSALRPDLAESAGARSFFTIAGDNRDISAFSSASRGDIVACVASDALTLPAIHVLRKQHSLFIEEHKFSLNSSFQQTCTLGVSKRYSLARPHGPITVWIYLPPDAREDEAESVPVLVNIHGGPHAQYGERFFDEFAVYANAGYAVVFTNPHGSTGKSEAFTRAVREDWGGIDADDVLAAVDFALSAISCLDPARMGLIGGSYGGYLTSWIVAHDHRFAAACSERAVNNLGSFGGTSDIGFWFAEGQLGTSPFDAPNIAARHSPLSYASAIRTPLLIMHAEQDYRCPIEQAEQLYVALARRGHAVRFVRVPDADHELSRTGRPRQRVERFRHILDWFDLHLRTGAKRISEPC